MASSSSPSANFIGNHDVNGYDSDNDHATTSSSNLGKFAGGGIEQCSVITVPAQMACSSSPSENFIGNHDVNGYDFDNDHVTTSLCNLGKIAGGGIEQFSVITVPAQISIG